MESFSNANEISQNENGLKEINPTDTPDTSQPLDFSNDGFSVSDFASEKDGNKESEGQIKENSISEQGKLDTSKPIDFSSPEKSNDSTQNSDKTDTIGEQKFSDDRGLTPLTEADILKLKEETGWSDKIIDAIGSKQEAEIYKNAGLVETTINDRPCLVRSDIDMEQTDDYGRTNQDRMAQGLAPQDYQGKSIELHHVGQKMDGPLAELTHEEHQSRKNYSILHDATKESEIDRKVFNEQREEHWSSRAKGE
ncbi:MAG: HNH/ENDO VII family nuclease [Treponema sp.]|nr:HNH/ENDO VII family nuclease [Treponema sp.]